MEAVKITNIRVGDLVEVRNAGRRYRFRVDQIARNGQVYGHQVAVATGKVIFRGLHAVVRDAYHTAVTVVAPGVRTLAEAYAENAAREAR